ncbi:MAG TPA: hypothetical protein VJ803_06790 [Gemmatimonadaceae bacterium]|nr:hypothetical protein [Gemmatimonadaceae bacterium]
MSILRSRWIIVPLLALAPVAVQSQEGEPSPQQRDFQARRAQLLRELEATEQQLSELRSERVRLQARVDNALALTMRERAQQLLMSREQAALQELDSMLTLAQDEMVAQRDRMRALGDAVRRRTGAVLVVLLRADSTQSQVMQTAELAVNSAVVTNRTYSAGANSALQMGAVDQLYRADVLPTNHTVRLQVTVNGQPVVGSLDITAPGETVTYVQFLVRNGQLVPSTWTSKGTTPF